MISPKLVLFDCDGVLVDSEPIVERVFADRLADLGLTLSPADVRARFRGWRFDTVMADVETRLGRSLPREWVYALTQAEYAALSAQVEPIPGVIALIDQVEGAGITAAVASSGAPEKMRVTLGKVGLWDRFEGRIFSAVEVSRGKPAPDLFLFAADRMGVAPADTVVIEDSAAGVQAAKAAGMTAIGYTGGRDEDGVLLAAAGADRVVDDMAAVNLAL